MPLESYEELRNVDIKKYCKKRDGLDYLNWATCINLLRMHGADKVYWEPVPDSVTFNDVLGAFMNALLFNL